ncbi:hypothetical protein TELCIR_14525 [Teladorsagia circumcincta]|uniref:IFT80 second beta-propeller domain-containing protein n=1 Tax=Teladorsagia circumcincta TaxID=45464 RepID=A0A2G9U0T2_TELCI|nr:hypothetical protein TELCIR_14525 [Teladorsagia circumcincta]
MTTFRVFLVSDGQTLFVFSYEGRNLSEIKMPKGKSSLINSKTTSLSNDTVALVDRDETSTIYLFDPTSGKPQGDGKITHEKGVAEPKGTDLFLIDVAGVQAQKSQSCVSNPSEGH